MIGLWSGDLNWRELMKQEGIPARLGCRDDSELPALVILDSVPNGPEAPRIASYVEQGGLLLVDAGKTSFLWPELQPRKRRIRYIVPTESDVFTGCSVTYIESPGWVLPRATIGRTDRDAPAIARIHRGSGLALVLPFDPAIALARVGAVVRQFHAPSPRLPYETVSVVDRGGIRRIIANCLRSLLDHRRLPYVHLAYLPKPDRGLFGFRVDTDEAPPEHIETVARLLRGANLKPTWFLNTGELGVDGVAGLARGSLKDEDMQLHCYRHKVYHRVARDRQNLEAGFSVMRKAGVEVRGFAAPFGEWSVQLGRVLEASGILYSSEFSYSYDDLPSHPILDDRRSPVFQVPVHPICLGRLLWARASAESIAAYFAGVARLQRVRMEPCFLYDHPRAVAGNSGLVSRVLADAIQVCGASTAMTEFAAWWRRRDKVDWRAAATDDLVTLNANSEYTGQTVVVESRGRYATVALRDAALRLCSLQWQARPSGAPECQIGAAVPRGQFRLRVSSLARSLRKALHGGGGPL